MSIWIFRISIFIQFLLYFLLKIEILISQNLEDQLKTFLPFSLLVALNRNALTKIKRSRMVFKFCQLALVLRTASPFTTPC